MVKRVKFICLVTVIILLSGCWDKIDIDKKSYVIGIGLDQAENDETKVKVTYLIANPEFGTTAMQGGSNEPARLIVSFEAEDFISAKDIAGIKLTKAPSYTILNGIFVSEQFASNENFIRWMYDAAKDVEIRRDVDLIVTREKVSTYFTRTNPLIETKLNRFYKLIIRNGEQSGLIPPNSDLLHYFRITESDADLFLAIYSSTNENNQSSDGDQEDDLISGDLKMKGEISNNQFLGSAIFKEGKMIGKLTGEETRYAILLSNALNATQFIETYQDPFDKKYNVAVEIERVENNHVNINLNQKTIDIEVPLLIDVLTNHSMADYNNDENRNILRKSIEAEISEQMTGLIKKSQEEFKGNPFSLSLYARKKFRTSTEYNAFDWMKTYPDMQVNVNVKIKLKEFGRQNEVPKFKNVRD